MIPNSSLRKLARFASASIGSERNHLPGEHCSHNQSPRRHNQMRLLPRRALLASMASTMTTPTRALVVDSHLHVWSSTSKFAPGKEPPANLGDAVASAEAFAAACKESGVDRALIVQPINYLFDHTYVSDAE